MSNHTSNFSARERVAHKLAGAAYQMTFVEDYDRAMATMASAIDFWEESRDEPLSGEEAASIYDLSPGDVTVELTPDGDREDRDIVDDTEAEVARRDNTTDREPLTSNAYDRDQPSHLSGDSVADDPSIPKEGSAPRAILEAILRAHADGAEWVEPADLEDYGATTQQRYQLGSARRTYDYIQWRKVDGQRANEYRIREVERGALADALGVEEPLPDAGTP